MCPADRSADRIAPLTRAVLAANVLLAGGAGLSLTLAPTRTAEFFAFEIDPPVTAAWIGANFAAGAVLELFAVRERLWANASQAVFGVLAYDIGILASLMASLDAFPIDKPAAWVWLAVYCFSPLSLLGVVWVQRASALRDRGPRMPGWVRSALLIPGAPGVVLGLAFLLAPGLSREVWPWRLTPEAGSYRGDPAIARYVGAWLLGIGATLLHAALVGDAQRSRCVFAAALVVGPLSLLAMCRFGGEIDWAHPVAWSLVAIALLAPVAGWRGLAASRASCSAGP